MKEDWEKRRTEVTGKFGFRERKTELYDYKAVISKLAESELRLYAVILVLPKILLFS